ncbi:hypothetical protein LP417_23020 [Polaromonas sp. P1-6]|nr:hypothetical protein LP417_23020 [Polaromonas sp. P1-6]
MFYRLAGIRHTDYRQTRQLWPLRFDQGLLATVVVLAVAAPWLVPSLYLNTYLMPLLLWVCAALGLNLLMGGAGQVHLGYGAVMGIGAYAAGHCARPAFRLNCRCWPVAWRRRSSDRPLVRPRCGSRGCTWP